MSSGVKAFALAVASAFLLSVGVPDAKAALGIELLPNAGFEKGVNPVPPQQGADQPLLPVGWAFEGAAGLFDHTPHKNYAGSTYSAAISTPASGMRKSCPQAGVCLPLEATGAPKDTVAGAAVSVTPAWRPQNAIDVQPGVSYQVGGKVRWDLAQQGVGGAWVRVRWVDGRGVGLGQVTAYTKLADANNNGYLAWTPFVGTVKAPAGAVKAVPLFGTHDDAFITQVAYDDVSFRAII